VIEVLEVQPADIDEFIKLPFSLYPKDSKYVPPLNSEMRSLFSVKNPFFMHASARYFIALQNGKKAGRIISFVNKRHNEAHNEKTGFFGFFECVNDVSVAGALFDKAVDHLKKEGMDRMRGPMNFSTNEECGFLLEGFDQSPMIMTPYNPPYYNDFSEKYGMKKAKDLYGFIHDFKKNLPEKVLRVAAMAEKRGITVRPIDKSRFIEEMLIFKEVYNSAWQNNWGFIPLTDDEIYYTAERMKQAVVPNLTLIAEDKGTPIGFMGLLPDFNSVLRHMNGNLNPSTMLKALYYSRKITDLRLLLLGIKKEYRNKGVDALLFREGAAGIVKGGYKRIEFSWILEDNIAVQRIVETVGGRLYKKYRIYDKEL